MKAKFEFDMIDEKEQWDIFSRSMSLYIVLAEIKDKFRSHEKYDGEPVTREYFTDLLIDNGVMDLF